MGGHGGDSCFLLTLPGWSDRAREGSGVGGDTKGGGRGVQTKVRIKVIREFSFQTG